MDPVALQHWFSLVPAGLIAGLLGGLLGIGGGVILVPALVFVLRARGLALEQAGLVAVATSLFAIGLMSALAFSRHRRRDTGRWRDVAWLALGGAGGSLLGAEAALALGGRGLAAAFAAFEILIGLRLLQTRRAAFTARTHPVQAIPAWITAGLAAGFVSAFFGVGGGIVAVPVQTLLLAVPAHRAIANSSGLIAINALVATGRYLGAPAAIPLTATVGQVDLAAGAILAFTALIGAPLGVRWAHRLPAAQLRRIFGAALLLIGAALAWQSWPNLG